tara:strand:+ start:5779 stop:6258 length:480 start_codon:yes stop_codon:yes gene_type:complete
METIKTIDSTKQKLSSTDIWSLALNRELQERGVKYDKAQYTQSYTGLLSEMSQPNAIVKQVGNSLFLAQIQDDFAHFRVVNMDVGKNLVKNGIEFFEFMLDKGVTKFGLTYKLGAFTSIVSQIYKDWPKKHSDIEMGYTLYEVEGGQEEGFIQFWSKST